MLVILEMGSISDAVFSWIEIISCSRKENSKTEEAKGLYEEKGQSFKNSLWI
jgi:hypothetical protein